MANNDLFPFKSKEEEIFWGLVSSLPDLVPEFDGMQMSHAGYEPITFHFGSVSYKPDFVVVLHDPERDCCLSVVFEIKGSKLQKGYRETRKSLNTVAGMFTEHVFVECIVDRKTCLPASFEFITKKPFVYLRRLR